MIVTKNDKYFQGNTVLAPKVDERQFDHRYSELEKAKKEIKNKKIKKRVVSKVKVIKNIALVFIIGVTLIARYSSIYIMQKQYNGLKSNISEVNKENENLKVELLKYNNLKFIEETAINKLHMVQPDKSVAIYVAMDKNNFGVTAEKEDKAGNQQSILKKLKSLLF